MIDGCTFRGHRYEYRESELVSSGDYLLEDIVNNLGDVWFGVGDLDSPHIGPRIYHVQCGSC